MNSPPADLILRNVTREFAGPEGKLSILKGVDLQLSRGDALAVTGPSGSGKSTLLYLVGVLDQPDGGEIEILGQQPLKMQRHDQAKFRNRHIGFIFQDHHLLPQCTVLENVLLPLLAGRGTTKETERRAKELLDRVGLKDRMTHYPAKISGGERQRAAVCRALINDPVLLLADEPTGNLDRKTAEQVGSLLLELAREQQRLLICVTHSQELAERFPMRRELLDGQLVDPRRQVTT